MNSKTPRTDEAARQGCYFTTGEYASTCGKQIVHIDFARQLETELNEAKSQVNDLNNLLRHAGWGQGEIDSASSLVMELEESNAKCDRLAAELAEAVCGETEMDELVRFRAALKHIAEYDEAPIWNDSRDDAARDMLGIARMAIGINDEEI